MKTDDLDFDLPPELIAQTPAEQRAASRLLHYSRETGAVVHRTFNEFPSLLRPGDVLVFNDAKVLPARFLLRKSTGGLVEGLFLEELSAGQWRVLLKNAAGVSSLQFAQDETICVNVLKRGEAGEHIIQIQPAEPAEDLLNRLGRMPLPPYIRRDKNHDERDVSDRERYQTIFAKAPGAVAAPTAALHFAEDVLDAIRARGVEIVFVTLHVGLGTFKPVTASTLESHAMHVERYAITREAADSLNRAKDERRRIVAVGTTAARVLESQGARFEEKSDQTGIFIYLPYQWKHVDALVTNFHLPRSTLIALVAGMVGLDKQRHLYQLAIEQRYRFFSYGDAMFIE